MDESSTPWLESGLPREQLVCTPLSDDKQRQMHTGEPEARSTLLSELSDPWVLAVELCPCDRPSPPRLLLLYLPIVIPTLPTLKVWPQTCRLPHEESCMGPPSSFLRLLAPPLRSPGCLSFSLPQDLSPALGFPITAALPTDQHAPTPGSFTRRTETTPISGRTSFSSGTFREGALAGGALRDHGHEPIREPWAARRGSSQGSSS